MMKLKAIYQFDFLVTTKQLN